MRECLQEDYKGRFYEDFYRVAVQNERYDDWSPILTHLRQLFNSYLTKVLDHHRQQDIFVPEATNSCASQGNFLEVLNISLNVFDKHYLDRSFDRTGQMSVVITPGVGVFEVDRELTNITKQRIIDNGVGSDLVCVGEQPLHAVPLLKFHNKKGSINADDYSMPHTWINLSFYSTNKKVGYGTFVPRIKLPPERPRTAKKEKMDIFNKQHIQHTALPNSIFDYDAYDAQVFKLPTNQNNKTYRSLQRTAARKKNNSQSASMQPLARINLQRKLSDPDLYHSVEQISGSMVALGSSVSSVFDKSPAINIPARITENKTYSQSFGALNVEAIPGVNRPRTQTLYEGEELSPPQSVRVGSSAGASPSEPSQAFTQTKPTIVHRPGRSLINPFDPSHVTIKLTSNRRRWIHIFPKDPTGVLIQQHHYQASKDCSKENETSSSVTPPEVELSQVSGPLSSTPTSSASVLGTPSRPKTIMSQLSQESITNGRRDNRNRTSSLAGSVTSVDLSVRGAATPQKTNNTLRTMPGGTMGKDKHHATLLWGATGEQEWTAGLTTGVDWKSLCLPACLPVTTDYFPEDRSLHNDYVVADYNLLPEDMNEHARGRKTLDTTQVFLELVSQRLAQGFQMIVRPVKSHSQAAVAIGNSPRYAGVGSLMRTRSRTEETSQEYRLSIGRMFHKIKLCGSTITVTIYRPRHPYPQLKRQYKYRFQAPDMSSYEVSWVEFRTERLETYMWNHLDNYICFRGESPDYPLIEPLKFWRFRVLLVPDCYRSSTKTIMDSPTGTHSDIYSALTLEEQQTTIEGFLRFLEITVHRLKRPVSARKSRSAVGFRERLGSNRVLERPRPRSGGKTSERLRMESGNREMHSDTPEMKSLLEPEEENKEEGENKKVNLSSPLTEIVEMMRDPVKGVGLLNKQAGLPTLTFIAADATTWVCEHVEGASTEIMAVELLQKIHKKELICHASGDRQHPFVHGFFLYFFVTGNKEQDQVLCETSTYSAEWHEVEVEPLSIKPGGAQSAPRSSSPCPTFLQPDLPTYIPWKGGYSLYRIGLLDIDINNRSDRIEWGHLKHHSLFSPLQAFELISQWLCATGSVVADLMMSWQRKALSCGLHLFPVPSDPFALPYSYISDPLRGPILIPLNVACLSSSGEPFAQFTSSTWGRRMHLFQEAILERFGFVPYVTEAHSSEQNQYVHVTGNMFIMIHSPGTGVHSHLPYPPEVSRGRTSTTPVTPSTFPQADYLYGVSSPHVEYFHRLIADLYSREISEKQPGFLWSFNYMLTRRWKSAVSGDEILGEKMLHDFRQFCTNHHGRLRDFWDSHLPQLSPVSPTDEFIGES
ncbi:putative DEP domain-containing protein 5 isoform X5 [Penaeus vannamei]|uniref:Putative DEP domain-containing protein 5 isoform X5 n=1 Tax=Penaeus vannamei TaxID=6689 RepID=A0A423TK60_PENVA|nr:putative DEP domain-containing protein 5 isoform X5 [Penaeus vannamei]